MKVIAFPQILGTFSLDTSGYDALIEELSALKNISEETKMKVLRIFTQISHGKDQSEEENPLLIHSCEGFLFSRLYQTSGTIEILTNY